MMAQRSKLARIEDYDANNFKSLVSRFEMYEEEALRINIHENIRYI